MIFNVEAHARNQLPPKPEYNTLIDDPKWENGQLQLGCPSSKFSASLISYLTRTLAITNVQIFFNNRHPENS